MLVSASWHNRVHIFHMLIIKTVRKVWSWSNYISRQIKCSHTSNYIIHFVIKSWLSLSSNNVEHIIARGTLIGTLKAHVGAIPFEIAFMYSGRQGRDLQYDSSDNEWLQPFVPRSPTLHFTHSLSQYLALNLFRARFSHILSTSTYLPLVFLPAFLPPSLCLCLCVSLSLTLCLSSSLPLSISVYICLFLPWINGEAISCHKRLRQFILRSIKHS